MWLMEWFRAHHGAPHDTKLTLISRNSGQPRAYVTAIWWEILDFASRHANRGSIQGIDPEILSINQDIPVEAVKAILAAMMSKLMIVSDRVSNWEKRQPSREDSSRERMQRHRERKRKVTQSDAGVTHGDAPDKIREDKIREEKKVRITLGELSVGHIQDWLIKKRAEGKYLNHDEHFVLERLKDYCRAKNVTYSDYVAAYRNAFEWKSCQPTGQSPNGHAGPKSFDEIRLEKSRRAFEEAMKNAEPN